MYKKLQLIVSVLFLIFSFILGETTYQVVFNDQVVKGKGEMVVVLDAGHGGRDSGKIGINHKLEKDINLQITKKLKKELEESDIKVVMTRTKDEGRHKIEDLEKRVDIINRNHPFLAVSIHQNSYPDERIKGAQVFYYKYSKKSEDAARIIQNTLKKLDPQNKRQPKANNTYYLLKHTSVPTVIVECGFLSNWEEAQKLSLDEYQTKVAEILCEAIISTLERE